MLNTLLQKRWGAGAYEIHPEKSRKRTVKSKSRSLLLHELSYMDQAKMLYKAIV